MGFRMEKFGAEEMEVKLFLFAVLQICLLSPWGHREGPALAVHRGTGGWRGSGCFISTLRTPRLGLVEEPCARGQEALVDRVQRGLLQYHRASGSASCKQTMSILLQWCSTLECLWRGKRAEGGCQIATSKPCAKASLLELSRKPFAQPAVLWGHWGNFPNLKAGIGTKKSNSVTMKEGRVEWIEEVKAWKFNDFQICQISKYSKL